MTTCPVRICALGNKKVIKLTPSQTSRKCQSKIKHLYSNKHIYRAGILKGNRFHVTLRIIRRCVVLREIDFLITFFRDRFACLLPLWRLITQTCVSWNHRKKMKVEPSQLIPRKLTANLELLIVDLYSNIFFSRLLRIGPQGKAWTYKLACKFGLFHPPTGRTRFYFLSDECTFRLKLWRMLLIQIGLERSVALFERLLSAQVNWT